MKKVYHLKTCSTCQRILKEIGVDDSWSLQDIRTEKITGNQIDEMKDLAGSYDALFSKRAMLYKEMNLKIKKLTEKEMRSLILEHDTFLKRPVFIIDDQIFIGNAKSTIQTIIDYLGMN